MRVAEITTAIILGVLSIYIMWKSGEAPSWNPSAAHFDNVWLKEGNEEVVDELLYTINKLLK